MREYDSKESRAFAIVTLKRFVAVCGALRANAMAYLRICAVGRQKRTAFALLFYKPVSVRPMSK